MKIRLNKKVLAEMDPQVRAVVQEWRDRFHKVHIGVENRPTFHVHEDEKVTMINLLTQDQQTAQAAGEFAGYTNLAPGAKIALPQGIVAVVTGFFCGMPYLNIYQASKPQLPNS